MKRFKLLTIMICSLMILSLSGFDYSKYDISRCTPDYDISFDTLDGLEGYSAVIVKAELVPSEMTKEDIKPRSGGYVYTKTKIKIKEVYKGDLNKDDIITIFEPYYIYRYQWTIKITTEENYNPSIEGQEYMFFLSKADEKGFYGMPRPSLSRYPVYAKEDLDNEYFDEIPTTVFGIEDNIGYCEKGFRKIYKEVIQKYF